MTKSTSVLAPVSYQLFKRISRPKMAPTIEYSKAAPEKSSAVAILSKTTGPKCSPPLIVAMVGLPATGKTVLSRKLSRYLSWVGYRAKVFRVSDYRRKHVELYSHDLFRMSNGEAAEIRKKSAQEAMDDAAAYLEAGEGKVAILDGTNSSPMARTHVADFFTKQHPFNLLFVECICDDPDLLGTNTKGILEHSSDYRDMKLEKALDDLRHKMEHYVEQYQTISAKREGHYSFIKVTNAGENVSVHRLTSPLHSQVLSYASILNPTPKVIYLSRHGESEYNVLGRIGGDADLSPRGRLYAQALANHFNKEPVADLRVWTSRKRRTHQTASAIVARSVEQKAELDELDAGVCEGLSYEEMQENFPQEFAWRDKDKLRYRYPWGESYVDIMHRLEPALLELDQSTGNILVVSHQAVLRCMLGYFLDKKPDELPYLNVPLHTIIKLTSEGYNYCMELIRLNIECVDTYRQQPTNCSTQRSAEEALLTVPTHYDSLKFWPNSAQHLIH